MNQAQKHDPYRDLQADLQRDIAAIAGIEGMATMLEVVCRTTGMGFAAVARVTQQHWLACAVRDEIHFGLAVGGELAVATTLCNEIRDHKKAVVIDNVAEDVRYRDHHTPAQYGFQSYISMPIFHRGGEFFGTLCALDPRPAQLNTPQIIGMFKLFADLIGFHLDSQEQLAVSEALLAKERQAAELREQFIAVLGHDLRNPLASISAASALLSRLPPEKAPPILQMVDRSVLRMSAMIDNVLDFARGRLGGGLTLDRNGDQRLEPVLEQVIAELRTVWPDRQIVTHIALSQSICCDRGRIAQLFSNLVTNALTHGAADQPVVIDATDSSGVLVLSVANQGAAIPEPIVAQLFQPFFRESSGPRQQGLGLGLYIVAEIARAHGGEISVVSNAHETRFTFRMPLH